MSSEARSRSGVAIVLGGGVREALLAQPLLRACQGATVFASMDAIGALVGLPAPGRAVLIDESPSSYARVFTDLRRGLFQTAVVPPPARLRHAALVYFAGVPRRVMIASPRAWAASERVAGTQALHPVDASRRLAAAVVAADRPMLAGDEAPVILPSDLIRERARARWSAFVGTGRRTLVIIPGRGGWSPRPARPTWAPERFAVAANQSSAERVILINGAGDETAVRETRAGIAKPTMVINLRDATVEEIAAVGEGSTAVIGHDGDALHVAAAAGAWTLALVGPAGIVPYGARSAGLTIDDFAQLPARQVVDALEKQARVDSYA